MGNETSQLSPEQLRRLTETTPFDEKEISRLLKRYSQFDRSSGGQEGIAYQDVCQFPEFSVNPLVSRVLDLYVDKTTRRLHAEKFLYFCAILSSRASIQAKRQMSFRCLDQRNTGTLQYDEMYKFYHSLFSHVINDKQIMELVYRALNHPGLQKPGQISRQDYDKMITDQEIKQRFTVDLQLV